MDETIKDKIFTALMKKHNVEELLVWNEFTIADKLLKQAFLEVQWREMYLSANKKLEEFLEQKEEIEADIFLEVKHPRMVENDNNPYANIGAGLSNKEVERFIFPKDKRIKEIKAKINIQKVIVEFYLTVFESIKNNTWKMKNWIDVYKK
jgi:hypothetical protein